MLVQLLRDVVVGLVTRHANNEVVWEPASRGAAGVFSIEGRIEALLKEQFLSWLPHFWVNRVPEIISPWLAG